MSIRILIADDHPLLLKGLRDFLQEQGYIIVAAVANGREALEKIISLKPELVILDIEMPEMNGIEIAEDAQKNIPGLKVIFITIHNTPGIISKAMKGQNRGFLVKENALHEIINCLDHVMRGEAYISGKANDSKLRATHEQLLEPLTPSEKKILKLIAAGNNTREISEQLFISQKTVEKHRSNIVSKLNLPGSKNSLLHWALQNAGQIL